MIFVPDNARVGCAMGVERTVGAMEEGSAGLGPALHRALTESNVCATKDVQSRCARTRHALPCGAALRSHPKYVISWAMMAPNLLWREGGDLHQPMEGASWTGSVRCFRGDADTRGPDLTPLLWSGVNKIEGPTSSSNVCCASYKTSNASLNPKAPSDTRDFTDLRQPPKTEPFFADSPSTYLQGGNGVDVQGDSTARYPAHCRDQRTRVTVLTNNRLELLLFRNRLYATRGRTQSCRTALCLSFNYP